MRLNNPASAATPTPATATEPSLTLADVAALELLAGFELALVADTELDPVVVKAPVESDVTKLPVGSAVRLDDASVIRGVMLARPCEESRVSVAFANPPKSTLQALAIESMLPSALSFRELARSAHDQQSCSSDMRFGWQMQFNSACSSVGLLDAHSSN